MLNKKQYESSDNFDARVSLNARFRTSPDIWHRWIFRQLPKQENMDVLELGCGTGLFWLLNRDSIPASWKITLTDFSEGMLEKTKKVISGMDRPFAYEVANAEHLEYADSSFDIIIANLMLYHLSDRPKALQGIHRLLKKGGTFVASTFSGKDMLELNLILYEFLRGKNKPPKKRENPFTLDNGHEQLAKFFSDIRKVKFEDHLEITEVEPIIKYYQSFNGITEGYVLLEDADVEDFRQELKKILEKSKKIYVTKDQGMFICVK